MKFSKLGIYASFLLAFIFGAILPAQSAVIISDQQRFTPVYKYVEIRAGKTEQFSYNLNRGDRIDIEVQVLNKVFPDLSVYVCSERDMRLFTQKMQNGCRGVLKGKRSIEFQFPIPEQGRYFVVLDNTYSLMLKKKAGVSITLEVLLLPEQKSEYSKIWNALYAGTLATFEVQEFDLRVEPCGKLNAFSKRDGGHITFCSELFFEFIQNHLEGAIAGVYFHELSHTLLNLWGLPGSHNEETADEFAIVMLYQIGIQEKAMDYIKWFAKKDSRREAENMIRVGDPHPLSIQRVRNVENILRDPRDLMARWNRLLYPRMTTKELHRIVDNPQRYENKRLAEDTLGQRGGEVDSNGQFR